MLETELVAGFLAFQMGIIDAQQLAEAIRAWLADRNRDLIEVIGQRWGGERSRIDQLRKTLEIYLSQADGDVLGLLERMSPPRALCSAIRSLDDPKLNRCLGRISGPRFDPQGTEPLEGPRKSPPSARFHRLRHHSRGGLGVVFLASDSEFNREVALKQIREDHGENPEAQSRFKLEAQVTGNLEHPGVVPVYSFWHEASGRPCYAMRFIRGATLHDAVQDFYHGRAGMSPSRRNLEFRRLLQSFVDVCRTADYAHSRGVLHRDIKPLNILLGKYGETLLIDWGMAKVRTGSDTPPSSEEGPVRITGSTAAEETERGRTLGTLEFCSPEQACGRVDLLGTTSDVYSLGATLFSIITGLTGPFDGFRNLSAWPGEDVKRVAIDMICRGDHPAPRDVQPDLSPMLEEICKKAMALERGDRHPSAGHLAEAIETWLADQPVTFHRQEIERLRDLIRSSPKVPDYLEGLARALSEIGLIYRGMGRLSEAEEAFREGLSCYQHVLGVLPDKLSLRVESVNCRANLIRLLEDMGRRSDAESFKTAGREAIRALLLMRPDDEEFKNMILTQTASFFAKEPAGAPPSTPNRPSPGRPGSEREREDSEGESPGPGPFRSPPPFQDSDFGYPGKEQFQDTPPIEDSGLGSPAMDPGVGVPGLQKLSGVAVFSDLSHLMTSGFATILVARDERLLRKVVVKVLRIVDRKAASSFAREAQVASQLEHPSIVRIHGLFQQEEKGIMFMVQGLAQGLTLDQEIDRYHQGGTRPAELRRLLKSFLAACRGVHHANLHGVIHRDPKPANIVVGKEGEATVLDWGLCEILDRTQAPRTKEQGPDDSGTIVGTPLYMAPEQFQGKVDARTDVFILGSSLYKLLTGKFIRGETGGSFQELLRHIPHEEVPPPRKLDPRIDRRLEAICVRATRHDPADRYPSVEAMADDIEGWLSNRPVAAWPEGLVRGSLRAIRRKLTS